MPDASSHAVVIGMIADDVRRFLEQREAAYCLIGGHAVAARGYPRFTVDYDFLTTEQSVLKHSTWTGDRPAIIGEVNEHINKLQADAQAAWQRLTSTATSG